MTEVTPKRSFRHNSIVVVDDGRDLEISKSHTPSDRIVVEHADRWDLLACVMQAQDQAPFDKRCADALADEVDFLVRSKLIDSRSPAADALLSYRDPPTTSRSDRIVELEQRNEELRAAVRRLGSDAPYPDEVKGAIEQRGKLLAEIGTLRNEVDQERHAKNELADACGKKNRQINALRAELADREATILGLREQLDSERESRAVPHECPKVSGETSDGYHTFNDLYEHRVSLFIALCSEVDARTPTGYVWRSKLHSDGTMFEGWFVMGIGTEHGQQITYHLPIARWPDTEWLGTERETAPDFDGHTAADVLERLKRYWR